MNCNNTLLKAPQCLSPVDKHRTCVSCETATPVHSTWGNSYLNKEIVARDISSCTCVLPYKATTAISNILGAGIFFLQCHNSDSNILCVKRLVPTGSPSHGGDVTACPLLFFFFLVSISAFMTLSTVFHSINSPNNSLFSHSVFQVLPLPYWSLHLYASL